MGSNPLLTTSVTLAFTEMAKATSMEVLVLMYIYATANVYHIVVALCQAKALDHAAYILRLQNATARP